MARQPAPSTSDSADARAKSAKVGPLKGLMPYLRPYRVMIFWVAVALIAAAALTLSVPMAMRRVIDGFNADGAALIDRYFFALVGVAGALAVATALRFYLVSRLGERVMADIRSAVFAHVSGMSPAFYEKIMTADSSFKRSGALFHAAPPNLFWAPEEQCLSGLPSHGFDNNGAGHALN